MFDAQPDLLISPAPECVVKCTAAKAKRDAIKLSGGEEYEALLVYERTARAKFRKRHPEAMRALRQKFKKKTYKTELVSRARARGRKRGIAATITAKDLHWPTHCPVLGIELIYPDPVSGHGSQHAQPNWPSLDRYDPRKGYVPGNVYVISYRANTLKNNATYEEILKVAKYLARRPRHV